MPMPHIEDGPVCWCNPVFLVPCQACEGREPDCEACKTCNGASVVRGEWNNGECVPVHFDREEEN